MDTSGVASPQLTYMPTPPPSVAKKLRAEPMTVREADYWIGSYNAWVALWNKHERSTDLPLSPEWDEAVYCYKPYVLTFEIRKTGRVAFFKPIRQWSPWGEGWSFCREPIVKDQIVWAAWQPRQRERRLPW